MSLVKMTHAKRGQLWVPQRKVSQYEKAGWTANTAKPADGKAASAAKPSEQKASS